MKRFLSESRCRPRRPPPAVPIDAYFRESDQQSKVVLSFLSGYRTFIGLLSEISESLTRYFIRKEVRNFIFNQVNHQRVFHRSQLHLEDSRFVIKVISGHLGSQTSEKNSDSGLINRNIVGDRVKISGIFEVFGTNRPIKTNGKLIIDY